MDLFLSLIAIVVLLPLLPPIALILKLTGEGEIFFIQPRVGKDGKHFGLIKFATMLKDSPNLPGGDITTNQDPRVLSIGHFLRKTKINELPQLWNILKGEMSIVGPRPLTLRNFSLYPDEIKKVIIEMKPGLTGIGSICFRDEEKIIAASNKVASVCYLEDISPYKGQLEVWYKENQSLLVDIKLIILTAWVIVAPRNRDYEAFFNNLPKRPKVAEKETVS